LQTAAGQAASHADVLTPGWTGGGSMDGNSSAIEILFFAAIAIFLIFRLRAVLGRRTGEERERPNPLDRPPVEPYRPNQPNGRGGVPAGPVIEHDPEAPLSLEARLARITALDPNFDEKHFLNGARNAFQMIVQAFSTGDLATLRPLLSSQLYGELGRAISERRDRGELGPVRFEGPIGAELIDAKASPREIQLQVRFASRQMHEGDTAPPEEETIDLWTFARDPQTRDPNWQLVETASPH
jgi:predicted lipid-binding transport protein (Tim44 family)